jgi:hypothetical protein
LRTAAEPRSHAQRRKTRIEAVRLVSLVSNLYKNLNYGHPPYESGLPAATKVVSPSLENFDNVFYLLGDPPSVITAQFTGGEITMYLVGTKKLCATVRNSLGDQVRNKAQAGMIV